MMVTQVRPGSTVLSNSNHFSCNAELKVGEPSRIASRLRQAGDQALADWISSSHEDNRCCPRFSKQRRQSRTGLSHDCVWRQVYQFLRKGSQTLVIAPRPTIFNPNVVAVATPTFEIPAKMPKLGNVLQDRLRCRPSARRSVLHDRFAAHEPRSAKPPRSLTSFWPSHYVLFALPTFTSRRMSDATSFHAASATGSL